MNRVRGEAVKGRVVLYESNVKFVDIRRGFAAGAQLVELGSKLLSLGARMVEFGGSTNCWVWSR